MIDKIKNMASAVLGSASDAWKWLSGKKRRIAILSSLVMQVAKPHTLAYQIAEASFYFFGGADASQVLKNKLPGGLKK